MAVGLAGGFIEPLESPGLAITQVSIEMLASMLDARFYDAGMVARYNGIWRSLHDILHFLNCPLCVDAA